MTKFELLLDGGPYTGMEEKQKIATLLNWMTDKGQKIYKEQLIFPTEEPEKKDKNKLKDVLEVFEAHFTPLQSMIHSWYNLGALHSHHCKDQADFMSQLHSLSKTVPSPMQMKLWNSCSSFTIVINVSRINSWKMLRRTAVWQTVYYVRDESRLTSR